MANKLQRSLPEGWRVTVLDRDDVHVYQPGLLFLPFGGYRPDEIVKRRRPTLDRRVELKLQEIEGDAVFMYAAREGDAAAWQETLAQVRVKLRRFFIAFMDGMALAAESTPCSCAVCRDAGTLKLKLIVHSGRAVFHSIGGRGLVSGADVILTYFARRAAEVLGK